MLGRLWHLTRRGPAPYYWPLAGLATIVVAIASAVPVSRPTDRG